MTGERGRGTFVRDTGLPLALGVEQIPADGLLDLVFNMPGAAGDADMLRAGLRCLAAAGDLESMLRYQPHCGRPHERRIIAADLARSLGSVEAERVIVTSGGQHGLAVTALGLLPRGTAVACDPLCYPGWIAVARLQGLDLVPVPQTNEAMDPDELDRLARSRRLHAVYTVPTVHNPLGTVMAEDMRCRLVEVARHHDLVLIEDAAYAFLEPEPPLPLVTLAPERTVHVGGVSKSLGTGLRLGYLVAPEAVVPDLIRAIRATTWNAPALISALVTGWIEDGTLARSEATRRMDGAARQAVLRTVMGDAPLAHPHAGFAWLPLPKGARAEPIVIRLRDMGLLVSGAEAFATTEDVPQALRLAFGGIPMDELRNVLEVVWKEVDLTE